MVLTRSIAQNDDSDDSQIIKFLRSAEFTEILENAVNKCTSELLQKVNALENQIKTISDTNRDVIALITNAPKNFCPKQSEIMINQTDLNSSDSSNSSDATVVEQKIYENKKSMIRETNSNKNTNQGEKNECTVYKRNERQPQNAHVYGGKQIIEGHSHNNKIIHSNKNSKSTLQNENNTNNNWKTVQRKKRNVIRGTAIPKESENFRAADRKAWFYVGHAKPDTTAGDLKSYLEDRHKNREFIVEEIKKHVNNKSRNKAYKVGVEMAIMEEMKNPNSWIEGLIVQEYDFFRGRTRGYY